MRGAAGLLAVLAALCFPAGAGAYVYWANQGSGTIARATLDGAHVNQAFIAGGGNQACGVAVDATHVYWAHRRGIGRANLDGSGVQHDFITGATSPCGVAVDGTHVFWANQGANSIGRANLDGSNASQSFISLPPASGPCGVAVDGLHVYWAVGLAGAIGRAELNGSNVQHDFISGANAPCGVAVNASHLYWANQGTSHIGRANTNGSGVNHNLVAVAAGSDPCGVALDASRVWWATELGTIGRAMLDGTDLDHVLIGGGSTPCGVAVAPPAAPTVTATDPASPSRDTTPRVTGTAQPGATVSLYDNASCSGTALASGLAEDFNASGLQVTVAPDSTTAFHARVSDGGYDSGCSTTSVDYTNVTPPAAPIFTGTVPASPANDTRPHIQGSAAAGTTVALYANPTCSGTPAATGTAAEFASPGLRVTVPDGSTTTFHATAADSGVASDCSPGSIAYAELGTLQPLPPPPPVPPPSPPPATTPPPGPEAPSVTGLHLTPSRFATGRRRSGATVRARVAGAGSVRFTVQARVGGRRVRGRCVAPTRRNRRAPRCRRYRTLRGSFSVSTAGRTSLRMRWTGRLRGRRLEPGTYRLLATPVGADGERGRAVGVRFRILARRRS
jgi:virginiamycin B lyase